jgi:hypothetical protein
MNDTDPRMEKKMMEMMMSRTASERFEMGCSMFDFAKEIVVSSIKQKNPGISRQELRKEIFLRFYGDDFSPEQREKIIDHLNQTTGQ